MNLLPKTKFITALTGVLAFSVAGLAGTADVSWKDPEKYTDLGTRPNDQVSPEHFQQTMERHVQRVAEQELPDGAVLVLTITDVDLAGDVEPQQVDPIRIMRDIYPPRMEFEYQVMRDNEVVEEGQETISDLDYQYDLSNTFLRSDPFVHEKQMIEQWIRNNLGS